MTDLEFLLAEYHHFLDLLHQAILLGDDDLQLSFAIQAAKYWQAAYRITLGEDLENRV